jgi:GGDEF domain-containing protein
MFCGQQDCEFIAILTETSAEVAEIVAQRVQKSFARQLEKAEINSKGKNILFIGSASYPTNATHGHGLLEMSREALAQAEKEEKEFVSYSLNE